MGKLVYYVASSIDGFISGPNEDISQFIIGPGAEQYLKDLNDFDTVIMGRKTYEFGYKYGVQPGQPAYAHMHHHIFSESLSFVEKSDQVHIESINLERVKEIKSQSKKDIYLCGGGQFAGWLLDHGLIDVLKLKLNPIVLGAGVRVFGNSKTQMNFELVDSQRFDDGLHILTYEL